MLKEYLLNEYLLNEYLLKEFGKVAEQLGRELSTVKLINYVMRENEFGIAVRGNTIENYMKEMKKDILRMLCKDKRSLKTMRERVIQGAGYYGAQPIDLQKVA